MACFNTFKFRLKGQEFEITSPSSGDVISSSDFFNAIEYLQKIDPKLYQRLINTINQKDPNIKKPDRRQNNDIPYKIKRNLAKSGIEMAILKEAEWASFCENYNKDKTIKINPNAKSFFLDGKIYVRAKGFDVADSIHELSHLLLAVLKGKDFNKYKDFIHTLSRHPQVRAIANSLQSYEAYSDNYELDFEEEAAVRFIEAAFSDEIDVMPTFELDGQVIDTMALLDEGFKPAAIATFGITKYPGIINLFDSVVADVPEFGSEMFLLPKLESTGYIEMKQAAIEALRITALIKYYASEDGGNLIEKGECL